MGWVLKIFDTNDLNAATIQEKAKAGTVQIVYNGSEDKLINLVGSSVSFTMRAPSLSDGHFAHLYTYDERRYLVTVEDETTGALRWQGYLLPEQYDEPFTNSSIWVRFVASDGLGTLKFQYLDDADYESELSIAEIVAKCIEKTGLSQEIYVNPAISNISGKRWDQQYLNCAKYVNDKGEKKSTYEILSKILEDSLCCIFQDSGRWYVYGYNKRPALSGTYWKYDSAGVYLGDVAYQKSVKTPVFVGQPSVGVNTPKRVIAARHKLVSNAFDSALYKVENPGFVLDDTSTPLINHKWKFTDAGFVPEYSSSDGRVYLSGFAGTFDASRYVVPRKYLLFVQGEKIQWDFEFSSDYSGTESWGNDIEDLVVNGSWDKILCYDIFYVDPTTGNEVILYSNQNGANAGDARYQLIFDRNRESSLSIQMTAPETAYYNVKFYKLINLVPDIKTDKIYIDKLEAFAIASADEKIYQDVIPETYTQGIDLELEMHDDLKDYDNVIRLDKLGSTGPGYEIDSFSNVPTFSIDGRHFFAVSLNYALKVAEHRDQLSVSLDPVRVIDVLYDYPSDFAYAIEYDADLLGRVVVSGAENLTVLLNELALAPSGASDWVSWTDDVYRVNYSRYGDAVVEVLRNMYQTPHPKITGTAIGVLSMRDLINFRFQGDKVFYPTDLQINLDQNRSLVRMSQNMYGQAVTENLPPVVNAGPDQVIQSADSSVSLSATANDPDGVITTILWELISGDGSPVIATPDSLSTTVTGLTGDQYVFRITVTDDVGLVGTDEVTITRAVDYVLDETVIIDSNNYLTPDLFYEYSNKQWRFRVNPAIPEGSRIRFKFNVIIRKETPQAIAGAKPTAVWAAGRYDFNTGISSSRATFFDSGQYEIELECGRDVGFYLTMNVRAFNSAKEGLYPEWADKVYAFIQTDITYEFVSGSGVITNMPIQKTNEARK